MKRILLVLSAIAVSALSANAFLYVAWNGPSGFTYADGTTPLFSSPTNTALVQLVFSPDNVAGDALPTGLATGDTIIDQRVLTEPEVGNPYGALFSYIYGPDTDLVGYLYVRVFEEGTSIGVVPLGAFYYTGPIVATTVNPGPPTLPDNVGAGDAGTGDGDFGTYRLTQVVVPEPSVIALAALGAAVVAVRRFRRS